MKAMKAAWTIWKTAHDTLCSSAMGATQWWQ
jgi:hypothetical protein